MEIVYPYAYTRSVPFPVHALSLSKYLKKQDVQSHTVGRSAAFSVQVVQTVRKGRQDKHKFTRSSKAA